MDIGTLTAYFGGWSYTFTPLQPQNALHAIGTSSIQQVADPLAALREADDEGVEDDGILLVASRVSPAWTLVVETFGLTGFICCDRHILEQLRHPGQRSVFFFENDEDAKMMCVDTGETWCGLDMHTGRRWGTTGEQLAEALNEAGFPSEGPYADIANPPIPHDELAPRAIHAATGLELPALDLDGVWLSGIAR
ncbi:DUF6461 domain-containing protein [Streptomyces spiramyceticus]|uniref:DUF6461 domain-containing protein n=1 Tax=Streptomyces spiramyceticus TaxID=299717 RepID=UPI00237ACD89|nr:DUF6461 domain-containing protein [Streptomyces spiramyceticus]